MNQGCIFNEDCEEIGNIDFGNNEYTASLKSVSDSININETFAISLKVPSRMLDNAGEEHTITNNPDIWIRFTDQESVEPIDTTNVFNVGGETLHAVFDQYFEQNIIIGSSDNDIIFRHQASLIDNEYFLEIEYTAKQKGVYVLDIGYDDNRIMIEGDLEFGCINFIQPKIIWEENQLNRVFDYYSTDYDQSFRFVIEIRE
jgi:hypothetical protein